jgi:uncharacterized membrane protein
MRLTRLAAVAVAAVSLAACNFNGASDTSAPTAETASDAAGLSPSAFEGSLEAVGPEGAWHLSIAPEAGIALSEVEAGVDTRAAYSQPVGMELGVEIGSAPITVRITPGPCTNGMSGVTYDFNVQVTRDGAPPLQGCLYRPWSSQIVALQPAIQSCLRLSPGASSISYLRANDGGGAFMRVIGETGASLDCTIVPGGTAPQTTAANTSLRFPGEGDVLFFAAPGEQPGGECYAAPEVKNAQGQVIGWLADPNGC